jgi:hypothetical protein
MSNYFDKFPKVFYFFGDEKTPVQFQKVSKYVDLIDQFRDATGTYLNFEVRDGERPDALSYRLYGKSEYDWTFFLMNERLRETGWPLSTQEIYSTVAQQMFPNYTAILDISTGDSALQLAAFYPVGQQVLINGSKGLKTATVVSKNLEVGEITISADSDITNSITMCYTDSSNPVSLTNTVLEYEGTHHYINDSDEWVDYYFSTDTTKVPITNLEYLVSENDESRVIRIIKKESIDSIVGRIKYLLENE